RWMLERFLPDGSPDRSFGPTHRGYGAGSESIDFTHGGGGQANDLALQPDGRILITGWDPTSSSGACCTNATLTVARYLRDGVPDPSFGTKGVAETRSLGKGSEGWAVAVTPTGRIVVGG